jgi:hypothetical protein
LAVSMSTSLKRCVIGVMLSIRETRKALRVGDFESGGKEAIGFERAGLSPARRSLIAGRGVGWRTRQFRSPGGNGGVGFRGLADASHAERPFPVDGLEEISCCVFVKLGGGHVFGVGLHVEWEGFGIDEAGERARIRSRSLGGPCGNLLANRTDTL